MMLNDRQDDKDKYENQDESEYHFSDEEVSYEVEPETPRPATGEGKQGFIKRLSSSKRMIISLVVFLALLFIVYKMVSPTTTTPPDTEITPQASIPVVAQPRAPTPTTAPASVATTTTTTMQQQPMTAQPTQPTAPPIQVVAPPPVQPVVAEPPPAQAPQQVTTTTTTSAPAAPAAEQLPQQQVIQTIPAVIPVQSATVTQTTTTPVAVQPPAEASAGLSQLQNDYVQRINDFNVQNKALQDQVQALDTRVANMESEINQLVQALTRVQNTVSTNVAPQVEAAPVVESAPRPGYSVQAIIPGRAWLKADNGETITVAEGDTIKGLGRVTKIDPYDGVVEIHTGSKVITLSYGNGG